MTPDEIQAEIDSSRHEIIALDELFPREDNPRRNSDSAQALARAILQVGFGSDPVIQKSTRMIINGHTRLKAAHIVGLERIPVKVMDVDDRRAKAMALADNRISDLSSWDLPMLGLDLDGFDFGELADLGFDKEFMADLDPWSSDIEKIEKHPENLDGIPSRITVICDPFLKDEIVSCLTEFKAKSGYDFTIA